MEPLVASFESLQSATAAREALLQDGVGAASVEVRVLQDEAGPVQGNFVIGNGRTQHGGRPGPVLGGGEIPYDKNFRDAVHRGSCLVVVSGVSDDARASAAALLARLGGHCVKPPPL